MDVENVKPFILDAALNAGVHTLEDLVSKMRMLAARKGQDTFLHIEDIEPLIDRTKSGEECISAAYNDDGELSGIASLLAEVLNIKQNSASAYGPSPQAVQVESESNAKPENNGLSTPTIPVSARTFDVRFPGASKTSVLRSYNVKDPKIDNLVAKIMEARGERYVEDEPDGPGF